LAAKRMGVDMNCPNCGHFNPVKAGKADQAELCVNCGARLEPASSADHKEQYQRRPKRRSAWLAKFFASSLACTAVFFTVYVLVNALYVELVGQPQNTGSDPGFGYVSLGLYLGFVAFASGFLARIWNGGHFWPAALGAPMAMVPYSFLEQGSGMWLAMLLFLVAGLLGAQIGSIGKSGNGKVRRSDK
jgi:hypothetical protein